MFSSSVGGLLNSTTLVMSSVLWLCRSYFGLIIIIIIPGGYSQWSVDDRGCRTPDRETGNCVPIMECRPMLDLIKSFGRPIAPAIATKLHAYRCGSDNGGAKVCCPSDPINLSPKQPTILFHNRMEPPDVTNHKNINLLPGFCGYLDTAPRIVRGNNSALNEFPWMVLLRYRVKKNKLKFLCGGSIINKNYVLTAGHCIDKMPGKELISVRVGEHSIKNETDCERQANKNLICNPPVQDLAIEELILHPQYGGKSGRFINDIALIRVATINLDVPNAKPVCMPIGVVRDYPVRRVIVTGWGVTNPWTLETADILQKVGLPIADKAKCAEAYKKTGVDLTNTQICAGGKDEKDACGGDSGGPLLAPTAIGENLILIYVQQGIVSFGTSTCGNEDYPGIYTAVKYYMDWILDNMRE